MKMTTEIRIYFESLEQGEHFIHPLAKDALTKFKNAKISLVKLRGDYSCYSRRIAPIIFWKDPDILISVVKDGEEFPLLVVEFSNAVFTEDHELQRFDGLVASAENDCLYVKISPLKKISPSEHGGNIEFDYVKPYALIFQKFKQISFHFDWKVDKNGFVEVDKEYPSCPNRIGDFEKLVSIIILTAMNVSYSQYVTQVTEELLEYKSFKEWKKTLTSYEIRENTQLNTSRTRWLADKNALELKINRFGHAMDPERGMLSFYGTLMRVIPKMLLTAKTDAWYKDIPKESEIAAHIKRSGLKSAYDYLYCFMLGSGLHNNKDFFTLTQKYKNDKSMSLEIDISKFVKKNFPQINKAVRTIFRYSNTFYLIDESLLPRVILKWREPPPSKEFDKYPKITSISDVSSLDEDSVTYITIHNVLKKNKFRILAASYPGAQADRVILIQPGTGRRQERKYVDIIAYLPSRNMTSLQENKGAFGVSAIQKDIDKLSKYKTNKDYRSALASFQKRFEGTVAEPLIKIGVGFWSNPNFTISKIKDLDLKVLDYFVYITRDMKTWKIWKTGKGNMFSMMDGKVIIPEFLEVGKDKTDGRILKITQFVSEEND